jgi:O-antigen ligase
MGYIFTLLYISLLFITPSALMPSLASYRIQIWVAVAALLASLPTMIADSRWRVPQLAVFAVFLISVPISLVAGPSHWMGGAVAALLDFLPNGIIFLLILVNCRSIRRLKMLLLVLLLIAGYYVARGAQAYYAGSTQSPFVISQRLDDQSGTLLLRIRALGNLNDPNDFAQFIICLIPFIWLWYKRPRAVALLLCGALSAFFLWGMFLTHSRGSLVAAAVVLLFAFRQRIGNVASGLVTAASLVALLAVDFSGGRAISMQGGQDRLDLWGNALALFKSAPLFGVGYKQFEVGGLTAHNSYVLCLVELGVVGYFCWIAAIVFAFARLKEVRQVAVPDELPNPDAVEPAPHEREIQVLALASRLSLIAFLSTAFFLSRAYAATFWLVIGLAIATAQISRDQETSFSELLRLLKRSAGAVVLSVTCIYVILRVAHL